MSKHLHLDCFSGISGDMFLGALVDAGLSATRLKQGLKALPVDGYQLKIQKVHRGSLVATKVEVHIRKGYDKPLTFSRIRQAIRKSSLPPRRRRKGFYMTRPDRHGGLAPDLVSTPGTVRNRC